MQPTLNPTLLNGHASLLPEGGGAGASPAEGAPSSTASTPPPPSSTASLGHSVPASLPHEDLLLDYLRRDLSLIDIARAHNLSLYELIAWSQLPSTRASLQALRDAAAERDATHAALARRRAIDALATILETFAYEESHEGARETPLGAITKWRRRETARRAATTLLRITSSAPASVPVDRAIGGLSGAAAPASAPAASPLHTNPAAPSEIDASRSSKGALPRARGAAAERAPSPISTPPTSLHDLRRANSVGLEVPVSECIGANGRIGSERTNGTRAVPSVSSSGGHSRPP